MSASISSSAISKAGISGLFSTKRAMKNMEKAGTLDDARRYSQEMKSSPEYRVFEEVSTPEGRTTTFANELKRYGVVAEGSNANIWAPDLKVSFKKDGKNFAMLQDGKLSYSLGGKEAFGSIIDKIKADPKESGLLKELTRMTELEEPVAIVTDLGYDKLGEIKGRLESIARRVDVEEYKQLGIKKAYRLVGFDPSVFDDVLEDADNDKKIVHKALKMIEDESDGFDKSKIYALRRSFEKETKYHRKRNLSLLCLGIAGASVGAYTGLTTQGFGAFANARPDDAYDTPVEDHARQSRISDEVTGSLAALDADGVMDDGEEAFVNYLSTVSPSLQSKVVDGFLADGAISSDEAYQIKFLQSLPEQEHVQLINSGHVADDDYPDKDGMCSYFEHCIAKTPYNVYNGRYAIILTPDPAATAGDTLEKFLIDEQKFEPEKVIKLCGNDGTKVNFLQAISDVSHKATGNDLVYISFDGHGSREAFLFNDGNGDINSGFNPSMTFTEIDKKIDSIKAGRLLVTTTSCAGDAPVPILSDSKRVSSNLPQYWVNNSAGIYAKLGSSPEAKCYDLNKNGYVSIDEIFKIFEEYQTEGSEGWIPKMSDRDGIAKDLYLGDFEAAV